MQRWLGLIAVLGLGLVSTSVSADSDTPAPAPVAGAPAGSAGRNLKAQNSWFGSTGGVHVVDGSSGEAGTLRLQLGFDYFRWSDFLVPNDTDQSLAGTLGLSATVIDQLEIFASLSSRSNSNDRGNPILLQVAGDLAVGAKGYQELLPWLSVGADLRFLLLNTVGDLGITAGGTSIGLRGAATADLRHLQDQLPLIIRANIGYLFDNSAKLIESVEAARYESLPAATRRSLRNEDRHLVNRIERFGLGISRVDTLGLGLGLEAPLPILDDFALHPLLEWQIGIPINRQGYNCLSVPTDATVNGSDGCLALTGLSAVPSTLTLGLRALTPVRGLSALLAFDLGLLGTATFARELAPNRPWALILAVGYAIDTRTPRPAPPTVIVAAAPDAKEPKRQRIRGVVVERGFGTPVIGAVVRYPDRELSPQLTGGEGAFVSYEFEAGEVVMEITHPDYEPGRCAARIAPAPKAPPPPAAGKPAADSGSPETAPPPAAAAREFFALARCELTARPRKANLSGTLTDEQGSPVVGAAVEITGAAARSLQTGASGEFAAQDLPPGEYAARVDSKDHLLKVQPFTVIAGSDAVLPIQLVAKPKVSQVQLNQREVRISTQVMFMSNSAEIDPRSGGLLSEVADALARNPQVARVQVQGHTDNRGDPEANLELSRQRAEAVMQWLISAGVAADRLEAKGYGDSRPVAPNLTPGNRARNRRVQFIILKPQ